MNLLIGTQLVNILQSTILGYLCYETEYNCRSTIKNSLALLRTKTIYPIVNYSNQAGTYKLL